MNNVRDIISDIWANFWARVAVLAFVVGAAPIIILSKATAALH